MTELSKSYILWPSQIHILKGEEAENWKKSRQKVQPDFQKKDKIDGITRAMHFLGRYTTAELGEPLINEDWGF